MDGIHDLGGLHGLGPIDPEPQESEPWFHAGWERRAFAVTLACGALGRWTLDESRFARERQHPIDYLRHSYYENWLAGLRTLLVEKGLVTAAELESGRSEGPAQGASPLRAGAVERVLLAGSPVSRAEGAAARFGPGDAVRVRNIHPEGHTRAPRYVRGRRGTIRADHGIHVFADGNAAGAGENPQHLYSVAFAAPELWGPDAPAADEVFLDLWDSHLEPA
ncbi:MAG: nitrile hydratase subunit beta [Hyphomicrobiales bacterium]|nr:nitrile hydratase subunit beta [Hyphomicrobiales bacterium]